MCIQACWTASLAAVWQIDRLAAEHARGLEHAVARRRALNHSFCAGMKILNPCRQELLDLVMVSVGHVSALRAWRIALIGRPVRKVRLKTCANLNCRRGSPLEPLLRRSEY